MSEGLSVHPGGLPFAAVATAPRIPFPRNALVSYHYWRNRDISALADFTLVADSGAYSADTQGAVITVADLYAWATNWRKHFAWVAALDVIGDPVASHRNWELMRSHGVNAMPTVDFPRTRRPSIPTPARASCSWGWADKSGARRLATFGGRCR